MSWKNIPNAKFKKIYRLRDEQGRILTYGVKDMGKIWEYNTLKEAKIMAYDNKRTMKVDRINEKLRDKRIKELLKRLKRLRRI